jgi:hypothetical protein
MHKLLKGKEHLFRMAALFLGGICLFMIARSLLVPPGFGVYGHYRAGALADNRARPISFAGREACLDCHTDEGAVWKAGKHARVGCEACHGALARHIEDPSKNKAVKPDVRTVCMKCHSMNVAKPAKFPQVDPKEHMEGGPCGSCHNPHAPDKEPKK